VAIGTFDSRAVTKIEADNTEYLKALAGIDKAHERNAAKRVAELQRELELQGKTTEEAFATARARAQAEATSAAASSSAAGKAIDAVGGKLKEFGKGLLSGAIGGIFASVAGGSISSLVQKLFEPPSDAELAGWTHLTEMASTGSEAIDKLARATGEWAKQEQIARREAEFLKDGVGILNKVVEDITHERGIGGLDAAVDILNQRFLDGQVTITTYRKALAELNKEAEKFKLGNLLDAEFDSGDLAKTKGLLTPKTKKGGGKREAPFGPKPTESIFTPLIDELNLLHSQMEGEQLGQRRSIASDILTADDAAEIQKLAAGLTSSLGGIVGELEKITPEKGLLERAFGDIEQFDLWQTALTSFTGAVVGAFDAISEGQMSAEGAARSIAKTVFKEMGKGEQALATAAFAKMWGAIGDGNFASAGAYFKSFLGHQAAAAAFGFAAAGVGSGGGGGGGSPGSGASAGGGSAGSSSSSGSGGGSTTNNYYYTSDPASTLPPRELQRYGEKIDQARRGGGGIGVIDA
jgi:hypothetical protein